jgi:hypothetical protein
VDAGGASGGSPRRRRLGRGASGYGESESVDDVVDCFPERRWGTAGGVQGGGELQVRTRCSFPCELEPIEAIRKCAGAKGRGRGQRGKSGYLADVGIDGLCRRSPQVPRRDFVSLAAMQEGKKREKVEGSAGFI